MSRTQWQRQAADPGTSPEKLHEIAIERGLGLEIVASNPNASAKTLARLAWTYPEQVTQNPALPMLLMENPGSEETQTLLYAKYKQEIKPLLERIAPSYKRFYLWFLGQDLCSQHTTNWVKNWMDRWRPEDFFKEATNPNKGHDPIERMVRNAHELIEVVGRYLSEMEARQ